MKYNPFTLSFTAENKSLEEAFLNDYFNQHLSFWRICMGVSVIAYGSFGVLDAQFTSESLNILWFIRFGIVWPSFAIAYALSFTKFYKRGWSFVNLGLVLVTGLGCIAMSSATHYPHSHYIHFSSLILVYIFGFAVIRQRFIPATLGGIALFLAYYHILSSGIDSGVVYTANLFTLTAVLLVGMFISYTSELASRKSFMLAQHLHQSNQALEEQVQERTKTLSDTNSALVDQIEKSKTEESKRINLEKQLRQRQKMTAIGTLAGGIAHDFNNILGIIIGICDLIKLKKIEDREKLAKYIDEISTVSSQAAGIVKQILTFSRQGEQSLSPVSIDKIVDEVISLLNASLPEAITIQKTVSGNCIALADLNQMHQVIMNLCTNAKSAIGGNSGTISIELNDIDISSNSSLGQSGISTGRYILLEVSDTGCGIAPEVRERIFEPFFSTKDPEVGTGLGLAVAHGIVLSHGGAIQVESTVNEGSTFRVYLPAYTEAIEAVQSKEQNLPRGNEHVLLVDDESSLVEIMAQTLESLGYAVSGFTSSKQAWLAFQSNPSAFDIVVSDFVMPQMSGLELAKKILEAAPEMPFILCSGFCSPSDEDEAKAIGIKTILAKPVRTTELSRIIQRFGQRQNSHN